MPGGVACDCRYLGWIAHEIRDDTTDIHGRTFYEAVCVDGDNFRSFDHSSKVRRGHVIDYNVKTPSHSPGRIRLENILFPTIGTGSLVTTNF